MIHLVSFVYLMTFSTAFSSILIGLVYWRRNQKPLLLSFIQVTGALLLILFSFMITHYAKLISVDLSNSSMVYWLSSFGGSILVLWALPRLSWNIVAELVAKFIKVIHFAIVIAFLVLAILFKAGFQLKSQIFQFVLFFCFGYCAVYLFVQKKKWTGGKSVKNFGVSLVVTLVFMPLVIADMILGDLPFLPYNLSLTLFLFAMSLFWLHLLFSALIQPSYEKDGALSEYFVSHFCLTEREQEIITALISGGTNKAIGEQLFISPKTVENHLSSIYRKTEVKSRLQLVNLIKRNRSA